jgi:hypothetical protein
MMLFCYLRESLRLWWWAVPTLQALDHAFSSSSLETDFISGTFSIRKRQINCPSRTQAVNGGSINVLRKKCAIFIRRLDQGQLFKYVPQVTEGFKAIDLGCFDQA